MVGMRTCRWPSVEDAKLLQPAHTGLAETFRIGHDVGLRNRDEIPGAEKVAYLDLVLQCLLRKRTELAGQNILLFVVELHLVDLRPGILHGLAPLREFRMLKGRQCIAT